ncbi:MAG: Ig domain-containing protein [Parabacteroides sp.]
MRIHQCFIMIMLAVLCLFPFGGRAQNAAGWQCDIYQYQYDMTVYGRLVQNGETIADAELAAFVGDECRGIAEWQSELSYFYLRVRSNRENGETITLKMYRNGEITEVPAFWSFQSQQQLGYPSQPEIWTLPVVVDPDQEDPFEGITDKTEEVTVGEGELTSDQLGDLNDKLTGEDGSQLGSLDLSNTTITAGTEEEKSAAEEALKGLLSDKESLTFVDMPSNVDEILSEGTSLGDLMENSNPNAIVGVPEDSQLKDESNVVVKMAESFVAQTIELFGNWIYNITVEINVEVSITLNQPTPELSEESQPETFWGTVCLPFIPTGWSFIPSSLRSGDTDVKFYELVDKQFVQVTELKANTPYLYETPGQGEIKFESDGAQTLPKTETEYVVQGDGFEFVGTYKPVASSEQVYALQVGNGAFEKESGDVKPFQAYIRPITSAAEEKLEIDIAIPVTGLSIIGASEVEVGKSLQLGISYTPSNTTQTGLVWSSSDETIAVVDAVGKVTAKKEGKVTITVESEENSSVKATLTLTVKPKTADPTPDPDPDPTPDPTPDPDPTPGDPDVPVIPDVPDTPDTPDVPVTPEIPNPVVDERGETTATVTWVKVENAVRYLLNVYQDQTKKELVMQCELDKDGNLLRASELSFLLTGLDPLKSYYVETEAFDAAGKVIVTRSTELSAYDPTAVESLEDGVRIEVGKGFIQLQLAAPVHVQIFALSGQPVYRASDVAGSLRVAVPQSGWYLICVQQGHYRWIRRVVVSA